MKYLVAAPALGIGLALALAGCAVSSESSAPESKSEVVAEKPAVLTGEWKQANSETPDNYQTATIGEDSMEVYWVSDGGSTKALYWAGSYTPPTATGKHVWTSNNDTSKTESSLLASSSPTKEFTFDNGVISYEVTALGITTVVELKPEN